MNPVLVDTNIVPILFKRDHRSACVSLLSDHQIFVSFMARAELLLWPEGNDWGPRRGVALRNLLDDSAPLSTLTPKPASNGSTSQPDAANPADQ